MRKQNTYTVTNLGNEQKDYNKRIRNYSILMALRIICIALALLIPFPWNIAPILFAIFSPWFAVIIANNKKVNTSQIEKPTLELK